MDEAVGHDGVEALEPEGEHGQPQAQRTDPIAHLRSLDGLLGEGDHRL